MDSLVARSFVVNLTASQAKDTFFAWLVLNLAGGHFALPILVATYIFSSARRHPTLINMCLTWIFSSIVACLLVYTWQYKTHTPSPGLCIAQASLVYASPAMVATSAFGVIFHVWHTVAASLSKGSTPRRDRIQTIVLLVLPYTAFLVFGVAGAFLTMTNPGSVSLSRRILYCSLLNLPYSNIIAIYTAVVLLATIFFEVRIVLILRRNWVGLRNASSESNMDLQLIVRVVVFGVYIMIGFVLAISTIFVSTSAPDIFSATVPIAIFFLFGMQMDVFRAWMFWRRPAKPRLTTDMVKVVASRV